jgi:hypothetical protein
MWQFQCDLPTTTCETQSKLQLLFSTVFSSLLYFLDSTLRNLYPWSTSIPALPLPVPLLHFYSALSATLLCSALRDSTLLYSSLLFSSLLYAALLCSTSTSTLLTSLLCSTLLCYTLLFSTLRFSTLHSFTLLYSYFCRRVPTGHNDLLASENVTSWSLIRHMPTGHDDLCASENVTSWSLIRHMPTGHMIFGLVRMWKSVTRSFLYETSFDE